MNILKTTKITELDHCSLKQNKLKHDKWGCFFYYMHSRCKLFHVVGTQSSMAKSCGETKC